MTRVLWTAAFALAILISVSLHEFGHMLTAKHFGMKVTKYFVGFGPTIWSFRRGETEYGLKAIPLGGFCKIVGMTPQDDDVEPEDQPRAMWRFPVWKRTIVMAAGSITHFMLAIVGIFLGASFIGLPNKDYPQTDQQIAAQPAAIFLGECVTPDAARACKTGDPQSPAKAAGLQDGDVLTAINGKPIANFGEMQAAIRQTPPGPATVAYTRAGQAGTASVALAGVQRAPLDNPSGTVSTVSALGVGLSVTAPAEVTYGFLRAFPATVDYSGWLVSQTFEAFKRIPGKVPALWHSITGSERDPNTPISVVGASLIGGEAASLGLWSSVLMLFVGLNVFIGIFNLLPLLPVDGGHIAVAWYEKIRSYIYARRGKPDPGRVDYYKLMPLTYAVIFIGGAFTLLTLTADIINPITIK
ncbi:M50 family metallopeptidase [Micromonosporaceae bacterium Da 78-11]